MTVARRKRLLSIGTIGTLLTLLVMLTDALGGLDIPEQQLHDLRARKCQRYTPPPTDRIAHVDIDDGALDQVGRWPWSRTRMAELVDEMNVAGARLIVLDVLFSEPTPKPGADQSFGTPAEPATAPVAGYVDPDERLAESFRRGKNVVVAASLTFQPPENINAADIAAVKALTEDLELQPQEVVNRLAERGMRDTDTQIRVLRSFPSLRGEAMRRRINQELEGGRTTAEVLITKLLPKAASADTASPLKRQVREELEHVLTIRALRRFAATAGSDTPPLLSTRGGYPPIAKIASAAAYGGFVDYLPARDGVVRRIPLACWHEQSVIPAMGLVAACASMGVDVRDVRFTRESVVIPRPQGDLLIPTLTQPDGPFAGAGAFLEVPLFGNRRPESPAWERMYDYPKYREPKARVPVLAVVAACQTRASLEKNDGIARALLGTILEATDPSALDELKSQPPAGEDLVRRVDDAMDTLRLTTESLAKLPDRNEKEEAELKRLRATAAEVTKTLGAWKLQRGRLAKQLENQRADLAQRLGDRVVFVGSVATGAADFVRSSLDASCPGVYLHGAAFNAIMTGQFLYTAKPWITVVITLGIGLLTTLAVAFLSPTQAFAAVLLLGGGYAALNGYYLFDKHNLIVGAAGPLVCAGVVWSGVMLIQFIREIGERTRLTRRFSSYVDPTLVNYVIENPEQARLEAREKELTVCFTDLQGFTSLAEKLRAQSAKMLGQYMEAMVPLIRARRGYVNKFLGDGIMFFFGAPVDNPDHAADAVAVVLDMQRVMVGFNENLAKQNLPTLSVRAGVSTGSMVVGDAGPSFASDYTVLGDSVNLASRIESANKAFGTSNLVTAQTVDLLNGRYLVRPVANVLVVGKHESVIVYEAIAPMESATEEQKRIAAVTTEMFEAFAESRWDDCERALSELERLTGATKMIARYREEVAARRGRPTEETFRGQIQLFAK
jgi:class 3 adenylate cyclase/CHASE2 domain-containing sensor protein